MVKRFISAHFHANQAELGRLRHERMMNLRETHLKQAGGSLEEVLPSRPPRSPLYEYDPYEPVHKQGIHPIFALLDKQARIEERQFLRNRQFIPKPFMTPNVFLPAYLEVSYRSCTGAFVRLPHIKKDGLMEIPSPYPTSVHERASMFYARYGRRVDRRQSGYRGYRLFWNKRNRRT